MFTWAGLVILFCKVLVISFALSFAALVAFFAVDIFVGWDRLASIKDSFFISDSLLKEDITNKNLEELIRLNKILPFDSIFTQTLAYYDTIITILIGLLGIIAAISFIFIKYNSEEKSKEHIEKYVDNFFDTQRFNEIITRNIGKDYSLLAEDVYGSLENMEEIISSLSESITESNKDMQKEKLKVGEDGNNIS